MLFYILKDLVSQRSQLFNLFVSNGVQQTYHNAQA